MARSVKPKRTIEEHAASITVAADALLEALDAAEQDGYSISDYSNGHGRDLRYDLTITAGSAGEGGE